MNQVIDPDGNVIREGMSIIYQREQWIVTEIRYNCGKFPWLIADRIQKDGRKRNLLLGRSRLRYVQIIGFQFPKITYP